jgi:nucleoside phosphorylase
VSLVTQLRSLAPVALLALCAAACSDGGSGSGTTQAPVAVLSAFPAELAAVLDRATVEETTTIDDHVFRTGTIGGTRVVIAMTGIGLTNARNTTNLLLDNFDVSGVVVSAVAGSPLLVGDVTVPASWVLDDGSSFSSDPDWLEEAAAVAAAGKVALESCAIIPDVGVIPGATPGDQVCFPYTPRVVVGGFGSSSDPYGETPLGCTPNGNDVFACDADPQSAVSVGGAMTAELVRIDQGTQAAYDQETAAIARVAAARGLPFIAFRGSSDGGDDPLNLTGFTEFFAYYRLAAHNAAAAAAAFLERSDR